MDFYKSISDAFYNTANNAKIPIKCTNCNTEISVTLNDDGSTIKCPNCQSNIKVTVDLN